MIKRGVAAPEWFLDQPELEICDDFWIDAFYSLSTCRNSGMGLGGIPWTAIREYAEYYLLDDSTSENLFIIIKSLDNTYLSWYNKQAEVK